MICSLGAIIIKTNCEDSAGLLVSYGSVKGPIKDFLKDNTPEVLKCLQK